MALLLLPRGSCEAKAVPMNDAAGAKRAGPGRNPGNAHESGQFPTRQQSAAGSCPLRGVAGGEIGWWSAALATTWWPAAAPRAYVVGAENAAATSASMAASMIQWPQ